VAARDGHVAGIHPAQGVVGRQIRSLLAERRIDVDKGQVGQIAQVSSCARVRLLCGI
jgi:hypothetical protein